VSRRTAATTHEPERVREEFDRIADAGYRTGYDASAFFHDEMLAHLPARVERALDLGCGTGEIVRRLADRADHVIGLDLSSRMIEIARERSDSTPNVEYRVADLMTIELAPESFDVVTSVSTFHHLPLAPALERAASWVRPGGWLLVIDLFERTNDLDGFLYSAAWWTVSRALERTRRRQKPSAELQEAWRIHDANDRHPTIPDVRAAVRSLPGARVRVRPLWRWTLAWRKPGRG
jgi:ubiquinone/menaquinone biosynthesis C-methylase UbiE